MEIEIIKYLIFGLMLAYIPLWIQINLFISSLGHSKNPVTIIKDKALSKLLLEKTDTKLESIKISESNLLFGMMIGIPTLPQLILSRKVYDGFTQDELEYVVLHEAGHYKLWHSVKELVAGLILFFVGVFVLSKMFSGNEGIMVAILLGLVFGLLMIQFGRMKELEADRYTLERISNPEGMIAATHKFREAYKNRSSNSKLVRLLFYRGNPYDNRIKMANEEIERRKSTS